MFWFMCLNIKRCSEMFPNMVTFSETLLAVLYKHLSNYALQHFPTTELNLSFCH